MYRGVARPKIASRYVSATQANVRHVGRTEASLMVLSPRSSAKLGSSGRSLDLAGPGRPFRQRHIEVRPATSARDQTAMRRCADSDVDACEHPRHHSIHSQYIVSGFVLQKRISCGVTFYYSSRHMSSSPSQMVRHLPGTLMCSCVPLSLACLGSLHKFAAPRALQVREGLQKARFASGMRPTTGSRTRGACSCPVFAPDPVSRRRR